MASEAAAIPTLTGAGHGGNVHAVRRLCGGAGVIDFSANINPIGPPEWLRAVISRSVEDLRHYPDPLCHELVAAISEHGGYSRAAIVAANGSTELLYLLLRHTRIGRAIIQAARGGG